MSNFVRHTLLLFLLVFFTQTAYAVTPGLNWKDSYSVNGQCYCDTTYDHETGEIVVSTPAGNRTVRQICETIGPGPGAGNNPIYNDVQCGNGPPNNAIDEVLCPGRVDLGSAGCDVIGPTWNLDQFFTDPNAPTGGREVVLPNPAIPEPPVVIIIEQPEQVEPEIPVEIPVVEEQPETTNPTPLPSGGTTIQPVGFAIAASDFSSKDNRWVLVDVQTTTNGTGADPDGTHFNSAIDGKYLELLPDTKVTNADNASADNVWPTPGEGPQVHYDVNIEQAGTYAVYVHAFSTGAFDDTIHVGFDGLWPSSGRDISTCETRGRWIWTQCENTTPATITIPASGAHSIEFSARDDGFEFDQFVLQLLNDDGSPAIQPLTQLQAQNGLTSEAENNVDPEATNNPEPELIAQNSTDAQTDENANPDLGAASLVKVGSIGFVSATITSMLLLIIALCWQLRRVKVTAKNGKPAARSDQQA